jgi:hypothetical protein
LDTKTQKILRLIDGQTVGWSLFSLFYQKTSSFKNSKKKSSLTNVSIELKSFWSNLLEFQFLCKKNAVGVFLSERVGFPRNRCRDENIEKDFRFGLILN